MSCMCTGACKVWPYTCNGQVGGMPGIAPYQFLPTIHQLSDAMHDEIAHLRTREIEATRLLLKLCEQLDHMPDDVAKWLHPKSEAAHK